MKLEEAFVEGEDILPDLNNFLDYVGLDTIIKDRYSNIFLLQLFFGATKAGLNLEKVMSEIRILEDISKGSALKQPTKFKRPPLKGLWHKHILQNGVHATINNLLRGLREYGSPLAKSMVEEAKKSGELRWFSPEDINKIVKDCVEGNYSRLKDNGNLTGEWLIYAKHENRNYYLCLANHDKESQQQARKYIDDFCIKEFPFLQEVLDLNIAG